MLLAALVLASCSREDGIMVKPDPEASTETSEVKVANGEAMVIGGRLDNPYTVENFNEALSSVYPTRSGGQVSATDYYVRFLPEGTEEYEALQDTGIDLFDYPLDHEIVVDGDWYHDPSLPEEQITWQYAVVPVDFDFPDGIEYEIIDECVIPDEEMETRGGYDGIDLDAIERASFELTGNGEMLVPDTRAKSKPSGRITIMDGKNEVGVAGVKVKAAVFVKVGSDYTDANGNYSISKKFSAKPKYKLCFHNQKGFSIGFNLILVQASQSSLGKGSPSGIDYVITDKSDAALYRRSVVNNAAYDYFEHCAKSGVVPPPSKLRFWILDFLKPSCAVMLHQGATVEIDLVSKYVSYFNLIVRLFAPDIIIGTKTKNYDYAAIYAAAIHEMAHGSHFSRAGTDYWGKLATYTLSSFLMSGNQYGTGSGANAGYCEVAEMWAYHMENMLYKERYGKNPSHGLSYWFYPQVLEELENKGIARAEICAALTMKVTSVDKFKESLQAIRTDKKSVITKAFAKYGL